MAGLIQQSMPGAAPAAAAPGAPPMPPAAPRGASAPLKITPQMVMNGMHLQPAQKQQLQRIVTAGMKVMYAPQTHGMVVKQLQGPGPMAQKLSQGVVGLMGLLMKESQNSLPPNLIIPATMVLIADAAEFIQKSHGQITDQDVSQAMSTAVQLVLAKAGMDPQKVMAKGAQGMQGGKGAQAAPGAPAAAGPAGAAPAGAAPQPGAM